MKAIWNGKKVEDPEKLLTDLISKMRADLKNALGESYRESLLPDAINSTYSLDVDSLEIINAQAS